MATLYLDLDGVLADFDAAAKKALKGLCHYRYDFIHGGDALWEVLHTDPYFFANFPKMPSFDKFWWHVKVANPTILTALPTSNPEPVDKQKRSWVRDHLGWGVPVITCRTKDKPMYCKPGDILVDDRTVNKKKWEAAGGYFIWHDDNHVDRTIATLATLKVI